MTFAEPGKFEQPADGRIVGRLCSVTKSCQNEAEYTAQPPYGERIDACGDHITGIFGVTDDLGNDLVPRRIKAPADAAPVTVDDIESGSESAGADE
jgi:hypothetical protein